MADSDWGENQIGEKKWKRALIWRRRFLDCSKERQSNVAQKMTKSPVAQFDFQQISQQEKKWLVAATGKEILIF